VSGDPWGGAQTGPVGCASAYKLPTKMVEESSLLIMVHHAHMPGVPVRKPFSPAKTDERGPSGTPFSRLITRRSLEWAGILDAAREDLIARPLLHRHALAGGGGLVHCRPDDVPAAKHFIDLAYQVLSDAGLAEPTGPAQ